MKKRTKRDLTIFTGALALILGIVLVNSEMGRRGDREAYEKLLLQLQAERQELGDSVLEWSLMRETKGKPRTGGTFSEELLAQDGNEVYVVGFQTPNEEFRDVTNFILLPIPLECYFCSMPPPKDVMLVQLQEGDTTSIYTEPVLIIGTLQVNQGPDQKFFYQLKNAKMATELEGGTLTKKRLKLQHMIGGDLHPEEELLEPVSDSSFNDPDKTD